MKIINLSIKNRELSLGVDDTAPDSLFLTEEIRSSQTIADKAEVNLDPKNVEITEFTKENKFKKDIYFVRPLSTNKVKIKAFKINGEIYVLKKSSILSNYQVTYENEVDIVIRLNKIFGTSLENILDQSSGSYSFYNFIKKLVMHSNSFNNVDIQYLEFKTKNDLEAFKYSLANPTKFVSHTFARNSSRFNSFREEDLNNLRNNPYLMDSYIGDQKKLCKYIEDNFIVGDDNINILRLFIDLCKMNQLEEYDITNYLNYSSTVNGFEKSINKYMDEAQRICHYFYPAIVSAPYRSSGGDIEDETVRANIESKYKASLEEIVEIERIPYNIYEYILRTLKQNSLLEFPMISCSVY